MTGPQLLPAATGLLALCIIAETIQQISFKTAANRPSASGASPLAIVRQPLVWLGAVVWVVESTCWVQVLQRTPLSLAFSIMTFSYAAIPVAGVLLLHERMSRRQILGAALIFVGVVCVGLAGQ